MPEPSGNSKLPKLELSMEKRLFLFFALTMLVFLGTQYFFKPAPSPKAVVPVTQKIAEQAKPAAASAVPVPTTGTGGAEPVQAAAEGVTVIDTDVYTITLSNRGAVVKSWLLKKFKDSGGKPLNLVNPAAASLAGPFAIDLKGQSTSTDPNLALYVVKPAEDNLGAEFEFSDGKTAVKKSVQFTKAGYLAEVRSEVTFNGAPLQHLLTWRGGFGDQSVRNAMAQEHTVHFDSSNNKLVEKSAKDAKDGPFTEVGSFTFAGLEDGFFAAVALPVDASTLELRTYNDPLTVPTEDKPQAFVGAGVASGVQNRLSVFVGPKDIDILRKVNPKLETLVDWGFFGLIAKPLFLCLNWVNDNWTHNFGWAIILVTAIINFLLLPLKFTSLRSARRMQALQPKIQAINAKYKDVGMRDPKKQEQNQEVMALYKENGVNPVGGCLPMLVQLPFFYAFYRVLNIAIELRGAPWLWVTDLSRPESLPIHLLPIILVATQFLMQRMTPAAGVDPNQQKMMMFMPLIFGFMFYYASAGLVLYWLTGNVVGILQQLVINRFMPMPTPPAPTPKAPVKRVNKK
jgi:YidC/Oxa1 family membrane protein insertase